MKLAFMLVTLIVLITGCATTYQRKSYTGGYSETQLGENVFQVYFRGNGHTSSERAADFCLLRSAELTLQNGFRYFVIVDSEKHSDIGSFTTPSTSYTTGSAYVSGNYATGSATTTTYGGQTIVFSKPSSINTIICFKEKPGINGLVFDARFVSKSIKEKYGITE
jgi:uncharacterized protein YceK